jgi:hypothetical protein
MMRWLVDLAGAFVIDAPCLISFLKFLYSVSASHKLKMLLSAPKQSTKVYFSILLQG